MSRYLIPGVVTLLLTGCGQMIPSRDSLPKNFALTSASITLPPETITLPPQAELVAQQCTACHSADMILSQPPLGAKKWQAEIDKMRTAYHAAIDPKDDARLVAELTALQPNVPQGR